jgi:hypothetical protein
MAVATPASATLSSATLSTGATPTAASLVTSATTPVTPPTPSGPVSLTAPTQSATGSASAPQLAYSPAGCVLNTGNRPHIARTYNYQGVKVFEDTTCRYSVDRLYISVSLFKTDFFGDYYEDTGKNTNYDSDEVGAGVGVKCINFTQSTTFFGVAYSYSIEGGQTYYAEGVSPSNTLMCGTSGGSF